jgi:protein deglycase
MATVLVPLAQGCEELESVTLIDLLRRAEIEVVVAGLDQDPVKASRGVTILPDCLLEDVLGRDYEMIVLPGGLPGADHLNADPRIHDLLKRTAKAGGYVGAICAAPMVLATAGLLGGKRATSYPGVIDKMDLPDTICTGSAVEVDGKVMTSRGPGTAINFALAIIAALVGEETRQKVEDGLVR